jgi:hypothetical protein
MLRPRIETGDADNDDRDDDNDCDGDDMGNSIVGTMTKILSMRMQDDVYKIYHAPKMEAMQCQKKAVSSMQQLLGTSSKW